jgi:hypothetical protein
MPRVVKILMIKADPARIIEYVADPANHPAFVGPLKSVSGANGDAKTPGASWDWTFLVAGVELSGTAETVAFEAGRRFSCRTSSGLKGTVTYRAEKAKVGSKVMVEIMYEEPRTLLAKRAVAKLQGDEGARALESLKAILDQ